MRLVIHGALEALAEEEQSFADFKALVEEKIETSLAQFERGEYFTSDESKAYLERKKAAWRNERRAE